MADTPRAIGPGALPASTTGDTRYTVPALTTFILRQMTIVNTTSGALLAFVSVGADAAATRLVSNLSIPANAIYEWEGFHVIAAAGTLRAHGSGSGLTFTAAGVEVT